MALLNKLSRVPGADRVLAERAFRKLLANEDLLGPTYMRSTVGSREGHERYQVGESDLYIDIPVGRVASNVTKADLDRISKAATTLEIRRTKDANALGTLVKSVAAHQTYWGTIVRDD